MNSKLRIQRFIGITLAIALVLALLPAPVSAGAVSTSIPDKPPLPADQSAPIEPNASGDELWSSQFELGADNWIYAAVFAPNGDLYVGGDFQHIAGIEANYVAHWSASSNKWSALGNGVNNRVKALAFSGHTLYVGGNFNFAGGAPANVIASYDVNTGAWSGLDGGMAHAITSPDIDALATDGNGNLFAGGQFDSAGGVTAQNIAKWNGSSWSSIGNGLGTTNDTVEALAVSGNDIYAGGNIPSANIYHFNGSTWDAVGGGTDDDVLALAIYGGNLYVGGAFATVDGGSLTVNYIALYNTGTNSWLSLGSGFDGPDVDAIAIDGSGNVFAAGRFTKTGINSASRIAMWNGSGWSSLYNPGIGSDGVDMNAYGLAINGNDVIVTGGFMNAGSYPAPHIARWNTVEMQWYSPGNTVNGQVYALATSGSDVYVGGYFSSAGGLKASSLAIWNSYRNEWRQASPDQLNGCNLIFCFLPIVFAIKINGSDVYIGGSFGSAGGLSLNNIARLNGTSWNALGQGVNGCVNYPNCSIGVYTLALDGSGVDAGGEFTWADGSTVNNIARWDGSAWHSFADANNTNIGTDGAVYAIAPDDAGDYYIGGDFSSPASHLVFFDGYNWFAGWSAPNSTVSSISLNGSEVYIGGKFTNAGNSGANFIAASYAGSDWKPLGNSLDDWVKSISLQGSKLFVGGLFTQSGTLGVNHIASWDLQSKSWSNLGSGTDSYIFSLVTTPGFVYAGGAFTTAGGKPSQNLGRFGQSNRVFLPVVNK